MGLSGNCQTNVRQFLPHLLIIVVSFAVVNHLQSMIQQNNFSKLNTLMAWLTFAIAAVVYGLTVEPTASLWDCPEFIACGYKLEIGHPPGAPFFMLVANLFSQFASEPSQVALMVNLLSALLSAGCIFFLFLTITHLARKLVIGRSAANTSPLTLHQVIIIEACGLVGALAYTFSDTFWFSAVEAEVYAFSSFLTALMFWLILKWEDQADSPRSDRWMILIAYITGLSIGVHLLCLLCLPAMSFVVYFRKAKHITLWGMLATLVAGGLLVAIILYAIIPGVVKLGYYVILLAVLLLIIYYKVRGRWLRLSLASVLMILVGYSSYGVILIRANACPPMCENEPKTISTLGSYLSREQYGETPLYPRIYSMRHAEAYKNWLGNIEHRDGVPTKAENLRFFLTYQVNFMYWRYFMWNFVGRQNNIQGHGETEYGNWITGFRWVDDWLLGCDTSKLPSDLTHNKGRNVFYGLPLLLGLLGIIWQWRRGSKGRQQLLIVSLLFVMTGLAIVVYLNQTPMQPRERDYAYAGSFYAFTIWIGLAVAAIYKLLEKMLKKVNPVVLASSVSVVSLAVPLQMASQTWDDHDRSGRYTCRDFGQNYLMTMQDEGHPIIFTNGDNDTFPLWYNHEVEGVRTDTRDCNLEYLQTDWYIDQMKRPAYDSPALPISWHHEDYQLGTREYVLIRPELKEEVTTFMQQHPIEGREQLGDQPFELKNIIKHWVLSPNPEMQCIPTDSVTITSPKGTMVISLKGRAALFKNDLMVLEMLSHADWDRPLYTSISLGSDNLWFLRDHLVLEGLAYRVSPTAQSQHVDVDRLYDNVMHRFRYGNLSQKGLYVDEDVNHMAKTHQLIMGILIDSLLQQGDTQRAMAVCKKWQQEMPQENVPYTEAALAMARCFYMCQQPEQGDAIVYNLLQCADEWLSWIETIKPSRRRASGYSRRSWLQTMYQSLALAAQHDRTSIYQHYIHQYEHHTQQR